jgi:hypothetical protein
MKSNKPLFITLFIFILIFIVTTQFILPTKNQQGVVISKNVYIIVSEIFVILFLIGKMIVNYIKNSFINTIRFALLPAVTLSVIIMLKALGGLNILMEIAIPSATIILFIIITIM